MVLKEDASLRIVMGAEPSMGNRAIRGGTVDSIYYRRADHAHGCRVGSPQGLLRHRSRPWSDARRCRRRRTRAARC
jgi:hypothetical protein